MKYSQLQRLCQSYDIISFDIFDTLLKRDVLYPADVFELMEQMLMSQGMKKFADFAQKRRNAEKRAREKSHYDEITFDEIYKELDYSKEDRRLLMEAELETEKTLLHVNLGMKEIYDFCRKKGKTIYIISDMYLPKKFLEKVLLSAGYDDYKKFYLSCEYRQTKRSGGLFKTVCAEEQLEPGKVLHIGDSRYADCIGPLKVGMRFAHIDRNEKNTLYFDRPKDTDSIDKRFLYAFINNRECGLENRAERLGYEVLGPIIYGYCRWLHEQIQGRDAKVWFAARDMYLFIQAYRQMYGDEENVEYIYLSRKSLRPVYTNAVNDLAKSGDVFARGKYSIRQIVEYMGYSLEDARMEADLDVETPIYDARKLSEYSKIQDILTSPQIVEKENEICEIGYSYLDAHGLFSNNIILVDVGWHGTTQYILSKIQEKKTKQYSIDGCYIGCLDGTDDKIGKNRYRSFLFDEHSECMFMKGIILLESMILAPHGSTVGYKQENGSVLAILGESESVSSLVYDIQKGAKTFITDICGNKLNEVMRFKPDTVKAVFEKLVCKPEKEELNSIGDLEYENFSCSRMAKPQSLRHYMLHFKDFYYDLKYSPWRIGFLYRLFKVRLPYARIYTVLRNHSGKKT